jgi:predicted Holliday junction resolvase-like endonuclease
MKIGLAYDKFEIDLECNEDFALTVLKGIRDIKIEPEVVAAVVEGLHHLFTDRAFEAHKAGEKAEAEGKFGNITEKVVEAFDQVKLDEVDLKLTPEDMESAREEATQYKGMVKGWVSEWFKEFMTEYKFGPKV